MTFYCMTNQLFDCIVFNLRLLDGLNVQPVIVHYRNELNKYDYGADDNIKQIKRRIRKPKQFFPVEK